MLRAVKILLLTVVLTIPLVGSVWASCPVGDLNGDCEVNWLDLQTLTEQWLGPEESPADLNGDDRVDMNDFALLAGNWQVEGIPLVINEFMARNNTYIQDPQGDYDDWIEIYNFGNKAINTGGMYLTDNLGDPTRWRIPDNDPCATTIEPNDYLLIWADGEPAEGPLHVGFELDAEGDEIGLFDTDGKTLIDSIVFGEQTADVSYGRDPDASDNWVTLKPTAGATNNGSYWGLVADTKFSHDRGFYKIPFSVTITTETEGATIRYTTDCSTPTESHGNIYSVPININTTTCLRAMAYKDGWKSTNMDTHTYIFLANVITQTQQQALDAGYPSYWSGYEADYEMDPEIYTDPDYNDLMEEALLSIPTLSIVTDKANLFDVSTGIYMNPGDSGIDWERPTSAELFNRNDGREFQIDCGLRIQGGASRHPAKCPKHSLSFRFRGMYGFGKLDFPLFEGSPVERFDSVQLRGKYNNSWTHWEGRYGQTGFAGQRRSRAQYIRDQWIRDSLLDMGEISAGCGTYAHLYLNGMYWGVYNVHERQEASHYAEYFGGDKDRLDALHAKNGYAWPVDGNTTSWENLKNIVSSAANDGTISTSEYEQIKTKLDVVNLADYMIINHYGGNWDWNAGNNWRAAGGGPDNALWKMYSWDAERVLEGVTDNTTGADPSGLFNKLLKSEEFRILLADRVHKHFFNGGVLTPEKTIERWNKYATELDLAIIGESARWGDYRRDVHPYQYGPYELYTKNDFWLPEKSKLLDEYFPYRTQNVLNQYKSNGWYPNVSAPVFRINDVNQHGGQILPTDQLSMIAPVGTIWYTLDGNDPRLPAEGAPPGALMEAEDMTLTNYVVNTSSSYGASGGSLIKLSSNGVTGTATYTFPGATDTYDITVWYYDENDGECTFRIYVADVKVDEWVANQDLGSSLPNAATRTSRTISSVSIANGALIKLEAVQHSSEWGRYDNVEIIVSGGGGTVSPSAIEYITPITLDKSTNVKARVLNGSTWSALNEATYAVGPVAENLRITEIMYHPADTGDPNDPNKEFTELKNIGTETLNLNLVRFTRGIHLTFPPWELAAGEYVVVVRDLDAFEDQYGTDVNIADQYSGSLDNAGERIILEDAIGQIIHDFRYGDGWFEITDGGGFSLTIRDPCNTDPNAWDSKSGWRTSAYIGGSPGWDDSNEMPDRGTIVFNELLAYSNVEPNDWIELHNTTGETINIGGWFLSDNDANYQRYEIAEGTTIGPDGYFVFTQDANFSNPGDPGCHTPFALSKNGETVYLHAGRNGQLMGFMDEEKFDASEVGVSFGRYQKSTNTYNFVAMSESTPWLPNAYPKVGPIVINEIMYHPDPNVADKDAEYVELLNISGSSVTLQEYDNELYIYVPWRFTDSGGISFDFPLSTTMASGEYLLLVKNKTVFDSHYPGVPGGVKIFEWGDGRLDNGGEKIQLSKPGDEDPVTHERYYIRVDRVNYSDGSHPVGEDPWPAGADGSGESLGRLFPQYYGNDPNNWTAATPSPGVANP